MLGVYQTLARPGRRQKYVSHGCGRALWGLWSGRWPNFGESRTLSKTGTYGREPFHVADCKGYRSACYVKDALTFVNQGGSRWLLHNER